MSDTKTSDSKSGSGFADATGSAIVYSGPHYGKAHKIIKRTETLTHVEYRGDRFAVPHCDVEPQEVCEGCRKSYSGRTTETPDGVMLCPDCARENASPNAVLSHAPTRVAERNDEEKR